MYVVVTRYTSPKGRVIRHAYGLHDTRSKATADRHRLLREPMPEGGSREVSVCKVIDIAAMNAANS